MTKVEYSFSKRCRKRKCFGLNKIYGVFTKVKDGKILQLHNVLTVDSGEVKTAPTECKEKCFQMSHLPIFTIVKYLTVDDSSKKEVR